MPARNLGDGEVEADHRVDREHERRRQPREQQIDRLVALPVLRRAAPPEREHAENPLRPLRLGGITERREIGNQAGEPEQQGHGEVGRHREHVPDERAAELRPQLHRVRIREQPVRRQPRATGVQQREHRRARDREERHRFREPVDRGAPLLAEQQQDGGDQRPGVADTNPPDEVDDVERPADRDVVAPDADAREQQLDDRDVQDHQEHERDREAHEPADRRAVRQDDSADLVGDGTEGVPGRDDVGRAREQCFARGRRAARVRRSLQRKLRLRHPRPSPSVAACGGSSSMFGFRTSARYVVRGRLLSSASSA